MYDEHQMTRIVLACVAAFVLSASPTLAAQCGGDFASWLAGFRQEAAAQGIPARALAALDGVAPDPQVISLDRRQGVFRQSFAQFSGHRIAERLGKGKRMMQTHAALLQRIEGQFGVPALQIIGRGDLSPAEMRGAWAGEIGQAQFLPTNYIKFAVDFDRNGRRDLIHSVPDTLASIANLLKSFGWQRGGGYREGSANFSVLAAWNKSTVYQQTIAAFAERLDGE
jgi:membrane-bound lytic murein transglycosylase B